VATAFAALAAHCLARTDVDAVTRASLGALLAVEDPFDRDSPLHVTGSALVVHRASGRVLLRYHNQVGGFIQLGGHADPGERDPFLVARREAEEESGLRDLSWDEAPAPAPLTQVVTVAVRRTGEAGAHRHVDFRYVLFTERPELAIEEHPGATLRWVAVSDAAILAGEENLEPLFRRAASYC
jgi:8-oxo-dGTP pyrophosphatase MutT (NUDIX family)